MKTFTQRIVESSADYLTEEYRAQLIKMLTNAFKEEINAFYYYFIVKEYLVGINRKCVEEFFEEAAKDELYDHAVYLLKRIAQLGGYPVEANNLAEVPMAKHPYIAPTYTVKPTGCGNDMCDKNDYSVDVRTAVAQNIDAEKGAIETYRAICDFTQGVDIVTHREIKRILEDEIEHLQELLDLQADLESMNNCCCNSVPSISASTCAPTCPCEEPCDCDDCKCDKCEEPTPCEDPIDSIADIFADTL